MGISLLKAATYPNPEADREVHNFTYSLYPHEDTLAQSDTVRRAYMLNVPMTALPASGNADIIPTEFSAISLGCDHAACETVKEAEDGEGTVIRIYEYKNIRDKLSVSTAIPFRKAYLCDLLEREICELPVIDGKIACAIKGFEIITIKLK
jgi:alpha-mannosidase